jgi:hypothetical protein
MGSRYHYLSRNIQYILHGAYASFMLLSFFIRGNNITVLSVGLTAELMLCTLEINHNCLSWRLYKYARGKYRRLQKELYNFERVYISIQRTYTTFWTVIMFDARGTVVPRYRPASAPAVEIKVATFTGAQRARCVFWFKENKVYYTSLMKISHSVSQGTSQYAYNLFVVQEFCWDRMFCAPYQATLSPRCF